MLQIKDIRKKYITGDLIQTALDGVSLTLRDNEFVAILGPSGSGKTTLLNVIGGLDRYDSGDLVINGISTRKYSDRDWDSYRNHTIGFVFQSYNLIPHQTVLANVELALTISGISRSERRKRAKKALEDVGLGDQLHKRPNQMSGGQMQRVAIARALVNNPDILLADEPTGALDSETSIQIMDLLKEVAKDRLVVMVTHNPDLAYEYANRIVRVKDGRIVDDSNPFDYVLPEQLTPKHKNMGRASMSFGTALSLSFNNLKTKLARTLLTAFAGSIGIIGIALILSLSTGFQLYIDKIQEDTLSNYPLTIQAETADMASMMAAMGTAVSAGQDADDGVVVEQPMISEMFAQIGTNDLEAFKAYLEENYQQVSHAIRDVQYSYGVKPLIFSGDPDKIFQVNPGILFNQLFGGGTMSMYMSTDAFREMSGNMDMLDSQYDVIRGRWPESYDELVLVLSNPSQISDFIAYTIGLKDPNEINSMIAEIMQGNELPKNAESMKWTYDDLMALEFKLVSAPDLYQYNATYNVWEDMSEDADYMRGLIDNGVTLRIVGIVVPKPGVSATALPEGIAYTYRLTEYVIGEAEKAPIVISQLANPNIDVFTGREFGAKEDESRLSFEDMISVDENAISSAFGMNMNTDAIMALVENYIEGIYDSVVQDTAPAVNAFSDTFVALATDMLRSYVASNGDENGQAAITLEGVNAMVDTYLSSSAARDLIQPMATEYQMSVENFISVYRPLLVGMVSSHVAEEMASDMTGNLVAESEIALAEEEAQEPSGETQPSGEETQPSEETTPPSEETQPSEETTPPSEETQPPSEETTPSSGETQPPQEEVVPPQATISADEIDGMVAEYASKPVVTGTAAVMAGTMAEASVRQQINDKLDGLDDVIMAYVGSAFYVDEEKLASAFQFEMDEEELRRLMEAMSTSRQEATAQTNLQSLGYADYAKPISMSIYMTDFAGKEDFIAFLDNYNATMEAEGKEEQVISYTDITGIMMSSVRTIIDSVSYVLIAFVAVSLIVSSIMIGIITYISVMERTKEIGVLRAIGASKRNISQVFNAETFIIGLCSGLLGVGITLLLNIPINEVIHHLTGNQEINAQLPPASGVILVLLSMGLTLLGGLIPAKKAAKKDPVIALRTE